MNTGNFLFFDSSSKDQISNPFINANNAGAITLQIEGEGMDLQVEGLNDLTNPDLYYPIKGISLGEFKTYTNITKAGLYMFPCDGLYRIRIKSNGAVGSFKAYMVAVG